MTLGEDDTIPNAGDGLVPILQRLAQISGRDLDRIREERRANRPAADNSPAARLAEKVALRKTRLLDTFEHKFGTASEFHPRKLPDLDDLSAMPAEQRKMASQIRAWADEQVQALLAGERSPSPRLYMYGMTGSSKTTLGIAATWWAGLALAGHNRGFRWQHVTHRDFNAETRGFGDDVNSAIEKYQHADWLFFDELGGFNPTSFAQDCLARLVDKRDRTGGITIFATNYLTRRNARVLKYESEQGVKLPVLADVMDDMVISRVTSARTLIFPEIDYRQLKRKVIK